MVNDVLKLDMYFSINTRSRISSVENKLSGIPEKYNVSLKNILVET